MWFVYVTTFYIVPLLQIYIFYGAYLSLDCSTDIVLDVCDDCTPVKHNGQSRQI
jgi:hypothetical protein